MSKSKFIKKNYTWILFFIAIVLIIFVFYQNNLTGRIVQEICNKTEVCENVTVLECDESCEEVCENVTEEVCSIEIVETCNEECVEENNETICGDVCFEEEIENCSEQTIEVCENVCVEVNCTESIIENCSFQEICYEVEINVTNETISEPIQEPEEEPSPSLEDTFREEVTGIQEIRKPEGEETISLTQQEIFNLVAETGEGEVRVTKSEVKGRLLILRFEIGNYWVEKAYYYPQENLNQKIENDKVEWVRKIIGINNREIQIVKKEEFLT